MQRCSWGRGRPHWCTSRTRERRDGSGECRRALTKRAARRAAVHDECGRCPRRVDGARRAPLDEGGRRSGTTRPRPALAPPPPPPSKRTARRQRAISAPSPPALEEQHRQRDRRTKTSGPPAPHRNNRRVCVPQYPPTAGRFASQYVCRTVRPPAHTHTHTARQIRPTLLLRQQASRYGLH